jgi:hypothetical protein
MSSDFKDHLNLVLFLNLHFGEGVILFLVCMSTSEFVGFGSVFFTSQSLYWMCSVYIPWLEPFLLLGDGLAHSNRLGRLGFVIFIYYQMVAVEPDSEMLCFNKSEIMKKVQ